jgi:hypothetical protein
MTLFEAVERGDVAAVQALLAQRVDVNVPGPDQRTPLIEAAAQGALALVELLLDAGAEACMRDGMDETALLKAAANGHLEVARRLGPLATEEERALASSFLEMAGQTHGPGDLVGAGGFTRRVVEAAARAAQFVGYDEPVERVARVERAERHARKK